MVHWGVAIWAAVLLGLVQGLTEFLPVSSSGHLMLFQRIIGLPDNMLLFDILLHVATLAAVCIVFRRKLWDLITHPLCKTNICLVIATAISCALVLVFKGLIDKVTYRALPFTFLITAVILLGITFYKPKATVPDVTYKTAIFAGVMQGAAGFAGISRSGSTIAGAVLSGVDRRAAAEFSFILSIPIIIASFVFELISTGGGGLGNVGFWAIFLGCLTAFGSGLLAVKFMIKLIENVKLYWFSIYLGVLSAVLFVMWWVI